MTGKRPKVLRKYSAGRLATTAVFCPACRYRLPARDLFQCPACQFKGEDTMSRFPFGAPPLERLGDHAALFETGERRQVEEALQGMRRSFPQLRWRIATVRLAEGTSLGLFGFWLLNVSPAAADESEGDRPWTILLLIEAGGTVAVIPGYAAEPWLPADAWEELLADLHWEMKDGRARAVEKFLKSAGERLHQSWLQVRDRLHATRRARH